MTVYRPVMTRCRRHRLWRRLNGKPFFRRRGWMAKFMQREDPKP